MKNEVLAQIFSSVTVSVLVGTFIKKHWCVMLRLSLLNGVFGNMVT